MCFERESSHKLQNIRKNFEDSFKTNKFTNFHPHHLPRTLSEYKFFFKNQKNDCSKSHQQRELTSQALILVCNLFNMKYSRLYNNKYIVSDFQYKLKFISICCFTIYKNSLANKA